MPSFIEISPLSKDIYCVKKYSAGVNERTYGQHTRKRIASAKDSSAKAKTTVSQMQNSQTGNEVKVMAHYMPSQSSNVRCKAFDM